MCGGGGNKGMDTETYRQHYREIRDTFENLYQTEWPKIQELQNQLTGQLDDYLGEIAPIAKDTLRTASQIGKVYTEQYLPAVTQYMQDAQGYDTPERRAMARQRAMTDVGVAGDAARSNALAKLEAYGVDPSMTRSAGMDAELRLNTALGQAQAANKAEQDTEKTGWERRGDALEAGKGTGQAAYQFTGLGIDAMGAGMSAVNNAATAYGNLQGLGTNLLSGRAGMVDAMLKAKQLEQSAKGGSSAGAIGSLVGTIGGAALGSFAGPAGMMAGASLGGAIGGAAGGAMGGGSATPMPYYGGSGLSNSWGGSGGTTTTQPTTMIGGTVPVSGSNLDRFSTGTVW